MSHYTVPSLIQSPALSRRNPQTGDEVYEIYEHFTPSQPQRQQRPLPSRIPSRPSSSSGSTRTLRRTPKFEDPPFPRRRASSVQIPNPPRFDQPAYQPTQQPDLPLSEEGGGSTTPRGSRPPSPEGSYWPTRSRHISKRTESAIRWTLEEAIRKPFPFTPDLLEESALMSNLGGRSVPVTTNGSTQNGGPRATAGPAPGSQAPTARVMTPKEIMKRRTDREARNKAEGEARQREQEAIEEERLRERARIRKEALEPAGVAAGINTGGAEAGGSRRARPAGGRTSGTDLPVLGEISNERQSDRARPGGTARGSTVPASLPSTYVPAGVRSQDQSSIPTRPAEKENMPGPRYTSRTAPASVSQSQPRQAQPQTRAASATYRTASQTKLPSGAGATTQAQAGPSAAPSTSERPPAAQTSGGEPRNPTTSSFPHAFERWETLSSHWEGLTSYWIRRLEGKTDEMNREPLNQQLARQVTDLSAAGANLFHAVVELQRLRA